MRRLSSFFIFSLCVSLQFSISSSFASNEMLSEKINIENRISQQVTQEIEKILPRNSFTVFASASLIQQRKREVSEGEVLNQKYPSRSSKPEKTLASPSPLSSSSPSFYNYEDEGTALPGFSPPITANNNKFNQMKVDAMRRDTFMQKLVAYIDRRLDTASPISTQKETYHFVDNYKLKRVLVDVLVDKRISDKQYSLAESSLIKKMRASFGNQVSIRFQKSHLMSYNPPPTFSERLLTLLKENWPGLLFMVLSFIFLFSLLAWMFKPRPSLDSHRPYPYSGNPMPSQAQKDRGDHAENHKSNKADKNMKDMEEELEKSSNKVLPFVSSESLNRLLEKFVDQMVEDPLLSRHFLRQLDSEDKAKLLKCFNTYGMQENLKKTLRLSDLESDVENVWEGVGEEDLNYEKHELLVKIYNELKQYRKVMGVQIKRKFGYLSLLDDKELGQVFDEIPLQYLSGITGIMPSEKREELLNSLPLERKKELFTFLTSNEKGVSMQDLKAYDKELKHRVYDVINTASESGHISNASIMDSLVSEVQDAHYILSDDLMRENTVLAEKYKYHRVNFDGFLSGDSESILNCIDDVSNEVIAQSLLTVDEGQAGKLLNILSRDRRTIVASLISSLKVGEYDSQSEIAQNEILKNYKNYLYSRRAS